MNKDPLEQLKNLAISAHLSDAEKANMKAHILNAMKQAKPVSIRSPYFSFFTMTQRRAALVFAVLIVFLSTSTTALADKALPGDILYTIKTKVNEPVVGFFASTDLEKAEWQIEIASRRLDEAEKISNKAGVSEKAKAELKLAIERGVESAGGTEKEYSAAETESLIAIKASGSEDSMNMVSSSRLATPTDAVEQTPAALSLTLTQDEKIEVPADALNSRIENLKHSIVAIDEYIKLGKTDGTSKKKLLALNAKKVLIRSHILNAQNALAAGDTAEAEVQVRFGEEMLPEFFKTDTTNIPVSSEAVESDSVLEIETSINAVNSSTTDLVNNSEAATPGSVKGAVSGTKDPTVKQIVTEPSIPVVVPLPF